MPGVINVEEYAHPCALTQAGDLWCEIRPSCNEEGDGHSLVMSGVGSFSLSYDAICLITNDGSLKCVGDNEYGQLGNDKVDYSCTPLDVFDPFPYSNYIPAVDN
jgi:hypothetical protein